MAKQQKFGFRANNGKNYDEEQSLKDYSESSSTPKFGFRANNGKNYDGKPMEQQIRSAVEGAYTIRNSVLSSLGKNKSLLKASDGTNFGEVSENALNALQEGRADSYTAVSDEEKNAIDKYRDYEGVIDLVGSNGTNYGKISYDAYSALLQGNGGYIPKNSTEEFAIKSFQWDNKEGKLLEAARAESEKRRNTAGASPEYRLTPVKVDDIMKQRADLVRKNEKFVSSDEVVSYEPESMWETIINTPLYLGGKIVTGVVSGVEDASNFLAAAGLGLLSKATSGEVSEWFGEWSEFYAQNSMVGDALRNKVDATFRVPAWVRTQAGNVAENVGRILPAVGITILTGGAGGVVGAGILGAASVTYSAAALAPDIYFFLSSAGGATREGYALSGDVGKALNYGILSGAGEVATEKIFGGFAGTEIGESLIDFRIENKILRKTVNLGTEGIEEMIMAEADPFLKRMTVDPEASFADTKELLEAGMSGIVLSVAMNAATLPIEAGGKIVEKKQKNKNITILNQSAEVLNKVLGEEYFKQLSNTATVEEISAFQGQVKEFAQGFVNGKIAISEDFENDIARTDELGSEGRRVLSESSQSSLSNIETAIYEFGKKGIEYDKAVNALGVDLSNPLNDISEESVRRIHNAGMKDGARNREGGIISSQYIKEVVGEKEISVLEKVAKDNNLIIDFAETLGGANGLYKDGKITIALDADSPYIAVASHEIVHSFKGKAESGTFDRFIEMAVEYETNKTGLSSEDITAEKIKRYEENGKVLSKQEALEEIAADFAAEVFNDTDSFSAFLEKTYQSNSNKNVVQRIISAVKEVFAKIGDLIPHSKKVTLENTLKQFEKTYFSAQENFQNSVNTEKSFSLQGTSVSDIARTGELRGETADAQKLYEKVQGEYINTKNIEKTAKGIIAYTNSNVEQGKVTDSILDVVSSIKRGESFENVRQKALEISKELCENAYAKNDSMYNQYSELRKKLKNEKIRITEEIKREFGGEFETFRRKNFGRIGFSKEGGGIDAVYETLSAEYPEFFDYEAEKGPKAQLEKIAEVLDTLKPIYENPFGQDMNYAVESVANKLLLDIAEGGVFDNVKKQSPISEALIKEREKKEKAVKRVEAYYRNMNEKTTERREKAFAVKEIKKSHQSLFNMLQKPTNNKHVPLNLQSSVNDFVNEMGQLSKMFLKENDVEGVNVESEKQNFSGKLIDVTRNLKDEYSRLIRNVNNGDYAASGVILSSDLVQKMEYLIEDIETDVKKTNARNISDLSVSTLRELSDCYKGVEHIIKTSNKLIDSKYQLGIEELGRKVIKENPKKYIKHQRRRKYFSMDLLSPETFFYEAGETLSGLYGELREAEGKRIDNINEITKLYQELTKNPEFKNIEEVKKFHLNGKNINMTRGQIMELYLLMQQKGKHGGRNNIINDGFVLKKVEKSKGIKGIKENAFKKADENTVVSGELVRLSEAEINSIIDTLSENDIKLCREMQKNMEIFAKWGNEASRKQYGFDKFKMENYWTKHIDRNSRGTDYGSSHFMRSIEGFSAAKSREENSKPVEIRSAVDTFLDYAVDMATYNAYLVPATNLKRVIGFRSGSDGASVQRSLTLSRGSSAMGYIDRFFELLNGQAKEYSASIPILDTLVRNSKTSKVGFSLTTVAKQPMSYVKAAANINFKYLLSHNVLKKADVEQMYKYAPIARWKSWGFFGDNLGPSIDVLITGEKGILEKTRSFSMALAGKADDWTWRRLWNACLNETSDITNLERGSDAFYKAAGKRFNEIVYQTQVVDSVFSKPMLLEEKNLATKIATAFQNESITTYNILYRAFNDSKSGKKPKKKFFKTVGALATSSLLVAGVSTAAEWLKDDKKDEEEESYLVKFAKNALAEAVVLGPWSNIIYSMGEVFTSALLGEDVLQNFENAIGNMVTSDKNTGLGKMVELVEKLGSLAGVGIDPLKKDISMAAGLLKRMYPDSSLGNWAEYEIDKALLNIKSSKNVTKYKELLFDAYLVGDEKLYKRIEKDMMTQNPEKFNAATITQFLKNKEREYREKYPNFKPTFRTRWNSGLPLRELSENDKTSYKNDYIKDLSYEESENLAQKVMDKQEEFIPYLSEKLRDADDTTYNSVISSASKYAEEIALYEASCKEYTPTAKWILQCYENAEKLSMEEAEFIYYRNYYQTLATKRNPVTGKIEKSKFDQLKQHMKKNGFSDSKIKAFYDIIK